MNFRNFCSQCVFFRKGNRWCKYTQYGRTISFLDFLILKLQFEKCTRFVFLETPYLQNIIPTTPKIFEFTVQILFEKQRPLYQDDLATCFTRMQRFCQYFTWKLGQKTYIWALIGGRGGSHIPIRIYWHMDGNIRFLNQNFPQRREIYSSDFEVKNNKAKKRDNIKLMLLKYTSIPLHLRKVWREGKGKLHNRTQIYSINYSYSVNMIRRCTYIKRHRCIRINVPEDRLYRKINSITARIVSLMMS